MRHMNTILASLATPASAEPASPDDGDTWVDARTGELLTWDGTYWKVGELIRVETEVAVGGAAADHDIGWNVPTGFAVVKASARLLKEITAVTATKVGFGTKVAGDPNKYALTPALTAGQVHQSINPTWNDGGGDDLGLTACDNAGAAAGTIAGSGAADVRVMVWMRPLITLPS